MALEADLERGARAARILADDTFTGAFDTVKQTIHEMWEACPIRDKEGAHELRLMLKLLGDVRGVLEAAVEDGKAAKAELERLNSHRVLSPREWKG